MVDSRGQRHLVQLPHQSSEPLANQQDSHSSSRIVQQSPAGTWVNRHQQVHYRVEFRCSPTTGRTWQVQIPISDDRPISDQPSPQAFRRECVHQQQEEHGKLTFQYFQKTHCNRTISMLNGELTHILEKNSKFWFPHVNQAGRLYKQTITVAIRFSTKTHFSKSQHGSLQWLVSIQSGMEMCSHIALDHLNSSHLVKMFFKLSHS